MARKNSVVSHVTKGDVLDDMGFSRSESTALKFRADLLDAIRQEVERRNLTLCQTEIILDEYRPVVRALLSGQIDRFSLEKLICYSTRLGLRTRFRILPALQTILMS